MTYIPELKGKEAEEFIRKANEANKGSVDWSKQMEDCNDLLKNVSMFISYCCQND